MTEDEDDVWRQLADLTAQDREHSNVSDETFHKLAEIARAAIAATKAVGGDSAPTAIIARLAVEQLDATELEGIVQDWLEGHGNLGTF